jgi:hypothetical protein
MVAPPGGSAGAILVMPDRGGGLRVVIANLDEDAVAIAPEPGLTVEWLPSTPAN